MSIAIYFQLTCSFSRTRLQLMKKPLKTDSEMSVLPTSWSCVCEFGKSGELRRVQFNSCSNERTSSAVTCGIQHPRPQSLSLRAEFAKLISVWSKVRLTAASTLSAGMPKPINRKCRRAEHFWNAVSCRDCTPQSWKAQFWFLHIHLIKALAQQVVFCFLGCWWSLYLLLVGWRNKKTLE